MMVWRQRCTPLVFIRGFAFFSMAVFSLFVFANVAVAQTAAFTDITPSLSSSNLFHPSWADYDADGDLDLYLDGRIFRHDGGLNFTHVTTILPGQRTGVVWSDYDRDGDLDLAIGGNGPTWLYRNDGGDAFTRLTPGIPNAGNSAIAWGDYDGDGRPDLLSLAYATNGQARIYRNDGAGGFVPVDTAVRALTSSAAAWGDYDKDGDVDLLISGFQSGPAYFTFIYRNDNGIFTDIGGDMGVLAASSVAWGDYDNDGYLDALTAGGIGGSYLLYVYRNNRNDTFTRINLGTLRGTSDGAAEWVDFDNDGHLDIFLCGASDGLPVSDYATWIYRNNRNGTFSEIPMGLPKATRAAWGDVDADGDLDVFLTGNAAGMRLFGNNAGVPNTPPAPPSGLTATLLPQNDVLLTWSPGTDMETTNAASLVYALRVGRTPGGVGVVSPQAIPASGVRQLPSPGPVAATQWLLRDAPGGTNYWSVQSIDGGWAGSAFAAETTFVITNGRPTISAISNQFTVPGRPTSAIPFTIWDGETPGDDLTLTAISTNHAIVPDANLVFGGSGTNRTITLTPLADQSGTTAIILTVTDPQGLAATNRFELRVQTFSPATAQFVQFAPLASAPADFDNDGDLDVGTSSSYSFDIFKNQNGVFSDIQVQITQYPYTTDLAWIDYNQDGFIDLSAVGWQSGPGYFPFTGILRNNFGTNGFTWLNNLATTNFAEGSVEWADYDNDGDLDMLNTGDPDTYHWVNGGSRLHRNDRGVLTNSGVLLPAIARGDTAFGDYDNDGDLDLLIAGQTLGHAGSAVTKLFRNDGLGVFTEIFTGLPGVTECGLAWGDYNNDGRLDILLAGLDASSNRIARIYRNVNGGAFVNIGAGFFGVSHAAVAWGDYDSDGFLDALVAGITNTLYSPYMDNAAATTRLYRNSGDGTFVDTGSDLPRGYKNAASWGDFDNDGDLDLLLGGRIAYNQWNVPNMPPSSPPNLHFERLPGGLRFFWSTSSDAETTNGAGLNYNLRIGTIPGGSEIMPGHADPANGFRRVPRLGNVGTGTSWQLQLTNATYYWSVQAIDTALAGSAFAPELSVTISAPVISAISNRAAIPLVPIPPIQFTVRDAETSVQNLILAVNSSNPDVVANTNLSFGGSVTSRTLNFLSPPARPGRTVITISATDADGEIGTRSFAFTVEQFADVAAGLTGTGPVAWGDYDKDGDLDLACGSTLYTSAGDGSFVSRPLGFNPVNRSVAWGDYDADDDLDLLATGSNGARIFRNDGNNNFVPLATFFSATGRGAWGDFDNDGDLDLVLSSSFQTTIYRNMGSNAFVALPGVLPGANDGAVAPGDFDNDGDLDLLIGGWTVYRNNPGGIFVGAANLGAMASASGAWGDIDNDGDLDIAVAGSINGGTIVTKIYRNTGGSNPYELFMDLYPDPGFGASPALIGARRGAVAWGDYDNDGDLDLLITGETSTQMPSLLTMIYRNDNGSFVDSTHLLPGLRESFAAWGDYDRDGDLDIALSGLNSMNQPVSRIYRNFHTGESNRPPTAPFALTNSVYRKSATLSWSRSSDRNQSGGLTYNVRVGRSPGEGGLVTPMADTNGQRRIVAHGNAGHRQSWTITNLAGGTWYWSVQAIDHGFAGSHFITQQSFFVTNVAPVATNQSIVTAEDTPVWIPLAGADEDRDLLAVRVLAPPGHGTLVGLPALPYVLYAPFTHYASYVPATNYFGPDEFSYVVNDGTIDSAPAIVSVHVTPMTDVTDPSVEIQWLPGDAMRLSLLGEPWEELRIDVSDDLIHWERLTNFIGTNLVIQWTDPEAANLPKRFYRANWTRTLAP